MSPYRHRYPVVSLGKHDTHLPMTYGGIHEKPDSVEVEEVQVGTRSILTGACHARLSSHASGNSRRLTSRPGTLGLGFQCAPIWSHTQTCEYYSRIPPPRLLVLVGCGCSIRTVHEAGCETSADLAVATVARRRYHEELKPAVG